MSEPIIEIDVPSPPSPIWSKVKQVARAAPGAAKRFLLGLRDQTFRFIGDALPFATVGGGVTLLTAYGKNSGMEGANVVWWMGAIAVGWGMGAIYARGMDRGEALGMLRVVRQVTDGLVKVSNRKIEVVVDHKYAFNIHDNRDAAQDEGYSLGHRIIEAADTPASIGPGDVALTIAWPDGTETVEHVSDQAAARLGYVREKVDA